MNEATYSVDDVARFAGVRARTVRRWAEAKPPVLTPSRVTSGGHRRYSHQDVLEAQILGVLKARGMSTRVSKNTAAELLPIIDAALARRISAALPIAGQNDGKMSVSRG